jgi:hypothetical protein
MDTLSLLNLLSCFKVFGTTFFRDFVDCEYGALVRPGEALCADLSARSV